VSTNTSMRTFKTFTLLLLVSCTALVGCRSKQGPDAKFLRSVVVGPWISADGSELNVKMTGTFTLKTPDGDLLEGDMGRGIDMVTFKIRNDPYGCGDLPGVYYFSIHDSGYTLTINTKDDDCAARTKLFAKTWTRPWDQDLKDGYQKYAESHNTGKSDNKSDRKGLSRRRGKL